MAPESKKIGLLDHFGGGNLGDDATIDAVMHSIKGRWPEALIFGFSMNPKDTQTRHGIPSYPIRQHTWDEYAPTSKLIDRKVTLKERLKLAVDKRLALRNIVRAINTVGVRIPSALFNELIFLAASFRIIRSFDLLVISGGGQLTEAWGGPWSFPFTILKWVVLAKLSRVKCYFINVGAGPLHHPLSRYFVKHSLFFADYVSFRDDKSRDLAEEIGFTGSAQVVADCVYSLDISRLRPRPPTGGLGEPIVGISPMAYCDPRVYWEKDKAVYQSFIRTLAQFGSCLSQYHYRLALFSTDIWLDSRTIEELTMALKNDIANAGRVTQTPITGTKDLLLLMSSMDYIVTCRFHGVVFAHMLNIPVLAISHHPKVATLMNDLGLSEYCVDIRACDASVLSERFQRLVMNREEIKSRMARRLEVYKQALSVQFDKLFVEEERV